MVFALLPRTRLRLKAVCRTGDFAYPVDGDVVIFENEIELQIVRAVPTGPCSYDAPYYGA